MSPTVQATPSPGSPVNGVRFAMVAAGGFVLQLGLLHGLTAGAGLPLPFAVVIAVEGAILHNFLWHEQWTFAGRRATRAGWSGRLARFNGATAVVSVLGNLVITGALAALTSMPIVAANTIAVAMLGILNFLVADRWVFGVRS